MRNTQPLFDSMTHYRIELHGQVDVEWLQGFEDSVEIDIEQAGQMEDRTVLSVRTDQTGIVGFLRRLHGLGITIQQFQVISPNDA